MSAPQTTRRIEKTTVPGAVTSSYAQGLGIDEPLAMQRGGFVEYYQADGLGSVTSLTGSTGQLTATYSYDSFGNTTPTEGIFNPYRYTAREQDPETGLYYCRARYYDPTLGRFLSEDPLRFNGDGVNFYSYVRNSPISNFDPTGLAHCWYSISAGWLSCKPDDPRNSPVIIHVASGNNGGNSQCKNNSDCEHIRNRGPIPRGWWQWTDEPTSKPNGRVLEPLGGWDPGRDSIRSHSCKNAFGPSRTPPFCSEGCITGSPADLKSLNKLLDAEPHSVLWVGD